MQPRHVLFLAFGLFLGTALAGEPTSVTTMSSVDLPQKQALLTFIAKKKFLAEGHYPGATNEADRTRYESLINALAERLFVIADQPDPKERLMSEFRRAYPDFEYEDTEEREQALAYFEQLMDIFGVQSSDGLLNKLLYGFDPSQPVSIRNQEALAAMTPDERAFAAQVAALPEQAALGFLTEKLGSPGVRSANMVAWMRGNPPDEALSLTTEAGVSILMWVVRGRFMYSKKW